MAYQHDFQAIPQVTLGGRLGAYRYINIDEAIENTLTYFDAEKIGVDMLLYNHICAWSPCFMWIAARRSVLCALW